MYIYIYIYTQIHANIINIEHLSISQRQSGKAEDDPGRPPSVPVLNSYQTTGSGT